VPRFVADNQAGLGTYNLKTQARFRKTRPGFDSLADEGMPLCGNFSADADV